MRGIGLHLGYFNIVKTKLAGSKSLHRRRLADSLNEVELCVACFSGVQIETRYHGVDAILIEDGSDVSWNRVVNSEKLDVGFGSEDVRILKTISYCAR